MNNIRPFPPLGFVTDEDDEDAFIKFMPAHELKSWVFDNWLTAGGPFYNPDHEHVAELLHDDFEFLSFLWASGPAVSKKQKVLGICEKISFRGVWAKERQQEQMRAWFGHVPIYLITIDASFAEQANDRDFCRLIEHELYHIAAERDQDGELIYSTSTGLPKHYLGGHDVEVFHGEIRQWGADKNVQRLVEIATNTPFIHENSIASGCGNCLVK